MVSLGDDPTNKFVLLVTGSCFEGKSAMVCDRDNHVVVHMVSVRGSPTTRGHVRSEKWVREYLARTILVMASMVKV